MIIQDVKHKIIQWIQHMILTPTQPRSFSSALTYTFFFVIVLCVCMCLTASMVIVSGNCRT